MNRLLLILLVLLLLTGCNGYISRVITRSYERLSEKIEPAPDTVTTPLLPNAGIAVAWIGHATTLIQVRDKLFITDPLLTNTVGLILKRNVAPGLDPAILPKIDATLVSHIHFDHFSFGSLAMLPKNGTLVIPYGALRYTPEFGFHATRELKPWEMTEEEGVRITAVPVQHFSGRYGFDAVWSEGLGYTGYVLEYAGYTIFFGGDTGYNPEIFKEIGRRYKIDVAILPIAPGSAQGLGSRIHANPRGAVQIFNDLGARFMIPMHYGTVSYGSDQNPSVPLQLLQEAAKEAAVSDRVIPLKIGEQRILVK
jgi:L-ascorbate metabolism protein UlaG (beta-lactamase superfamily)